jgi:hypothetical protein
MAPLSKALVLLDQDMALVAVVLVLLVTVAMVETVVTQSPLLHQLLLVAAVMVEMPQAPAVVLAALAVAL